jgi:catechol 2,3-dioxygenase-like lactoylglutathione lyase family enzyme
MLCDVTVSIDHLALPAADAETSARWFAEILGLATPLPDGPDEDMFKVRLNDSSSVLFVSEPAGPGHHVAFAVSAAEFIAIVDRLRQRGVDFGNDPEDPTNGQTEDVLGSQGRVYFRSPDGHFLEVTVST